MFNARQLLGLELSGRIISKTADERVRNALATNLSDLLRYQNMLCRYDTVALKSLDAVFTDPPYFGNVQYAELMDFCYVWLRRLVGEKVEAFDRESTRNSEELTGNEDMGRGLEHFTQGLSTVYQRMAAALKPGSPLAFTYHHNDLQAYLPVAVAILDAGLACSASLPCPAEMGASIHINGTGSSIIDTVFVCRSTGTVSRKWLPDSIQGVADLVAEDLARLREGGVTPTLGDARCVTYGQLIRLAVWHLRKEWNKKAPVAEKMQTVADWLRKFGGWNEVEKLLEDANQSRFETLLFAVREETKPYGNQDADIPF